MVFRISLIALLLIAQGCRKYPELTFPILPDRLYLSAVWQTVYVGDEPGEFELIESFEYDEENRLVQIEKFEPGHHIRFAIGYDMYSLPFEVVIYRDGNIYQKIKFTFQQGKLHLAKTYSEFSGRLLFEDHFTYDPIGRLTHYKRISEISRHQLQFSWFEGNVNRIDETYGGQSFFYEYDHDLMRNPYRDVFKHLGVDLLHRLPLISNNQVRERAFRSFEEKEVNRLDAVYNYRQPGYPYYARIVTEDDLGRKQEVARKFEYLPAPIN